MNKFKSTTSLSHPAIHHKLFRSNLRWFRLDQIRKQGVRLSQANMILSLWLTFLGKICEPYLFRLLVKPLRSRMEDLKIRSFLRWHRFYHSDPLSLIGPKVEKSIWFWRKVLDCSSTLNFLSTSSNFKQNIIISLSKKSIKIVYKAGQIR